MSDSGEILYKLGLFSGVAFSVSWLKHALRLNDYWTGESMNPLKAILCTYVADSAAYWHDHELHGVENLAQENCLLVGYHSRCTVDNLYVWCRIHANFLISHVFFSIPGVSMIVKNLGAVPSKGLMTSTSDEAFAELLRAGHRPMMLLPGGAFEAMKPWDKMHIVDWKRHPGFARIICGNDDLKRSVRVVPFYTRNSERIFFNFKWWFDFSGQFVQNGLNDAYKGILWKLPLVLSAGIYSFGVSFLPRPVKLDTYFGEPIYYQAGESIEQFGERVRIGLQNMIDAKNAEPEHPNRNLTLVKMPYTIVKGVLMAIQLSTFQLSNILLYFTALPIGIGMFSVFGGLRRNSK